jgi:large subunit ribosomal protein L25
MAEVIQLVVERREVRGSMGARRLRRKGLVPGVVYGHKEAVVPVAFDGEVVLKAVRHGVRVLDLQADGSVQKALIRELQWDHLGKDLLHVDFYRVAADERIRVPVALELRGTAPGVSAGGVLDQPLHNVDIECLAIAVPESIRVNINELQLGQALHVKDLHLPEGVKVLADPDAVVVQVKSPEEEPEPTAGPAAEQAEPEVIGRQAKAAEEEEEK